MKSVEFCYWLQGLFELSPERVLALSAPQTEIIRRHLALVFAHEIDPIYGRHSEVQENLNAIHNPNQQQFTTQPVWIDPSLKARC